MTKISLTDASIQKIIGVQADVINGTFHHIMIIIKADRINPEDFKGLPTRGNVVIEVE